MTKTKMLIYTLPLLYLFLTGISSCEVENPDPEPDPNPVDSTEVTLQPGLLVSIDNVSVNPVYAREGRTIQLEVRLFNNENTKEDLNISLALPEYVQITDEDTIQLISLGYSREGTASFNVMSSKTTISSYVVRVDNGKKYTSKTYLLEFRPPYDVQPADYVPEPVIAETEGYMVGAFRCPLWYEGTRPSCWTPFRNTFAERVPVLGFYNEANPEVIDWEIKFAVENGISFFVDCWYRDKNNEGKSPIVARLDHWVTKLKDARYKDMIKFALLWENTNDIAAGIASEEDLLQNLLPYWIDTYFSESNYMTVEGKPLLVIYGYKKFIEQLGGEENAKSALNKMDQALTDAGFNGLFPITAHNSHFRNDLSYLKEIGFKSIVSYHVPTFTGEMNTSNIPAQSEIVRIQEVCWNKLKDKSTLPTYPVVTMGWDSEPWGFAYNKGQWAITGTNYETLCEKAKSFAEYLPEENRIVMLDNWNEYGEGHYIAPTQKYGFMHLDAIRKTFSSSMEANNIVPEDVNLGPYDYPIGE
jgi:hypothetical protein